MNPLNLPRQEDVEDFDLGSQRVSVVKLTDENRSAMAKLALSMYANEPCRICGVILTIDDIKQGAVFAGYSIDNSARSAHKSCWDAGIPMSEWVHQ